MAPPKRVLIVDDVSVTRRLMANVVSTMGATLVDTVENGAEAIHKATYTNYDLILMDLAMPVMDGYQATRMLRQRGFERPIIAITSTVIEEAVVACAEAGCDSCIPKPVSKERLLLSLANIHRQ